MYAQWSFKPSKHPHVSSKLFDVFNPNAHPTSYNSKTKMSEQKPVLYSVIEQQSESVCVVVSTVRCWIFKDFTERKKRISAKERYIKHFKRFEPCLFFSFWHFLRCVFLFFGIATHIHTAHTVLSVLLVASDEYARNTHTHTTYWLPHRASSEGIQIRKNCKQNIRLAVSFFGVPKQHKGFLICKLCRDL